MCSIDTSKADWLTKLPTSGTEQPDQQNRSANCLLLVCREGNERHESRSITYDHLRKEVCKFANFLTSKGLKKGDRIAIYMPVTIDLVVAMLGAARIGVIHTVVVSSAISMLIAYCQGHIQVCRLLRSVLVRANHRCKMFSGSYHGRCPARYKGDSTQRNHRLCHRYLSQ